MQRTLERKSGALEFVAASAKVDFRTLGEAYVAATRPHRDSRPHFIDKLPFNYLYAGLIHLALPRAKIINLQRNPLDTCFAVYKQLFRDAYPFSYDLRELGQYYAPITPGQHWHAVMPGVIHTFATRRSSPTSKAKRDACLPTAACAGRPVPEFHERREASTTASALRSANRCMRRRSASGALRATTRTAPPAARERRHRYALILRAHCDGIAAHAITATAAQLSPRRNVSSLTTR